MKTQNTIKIAITTLIILISQISFSQSTCIANSNETEQNSNNVSKIETVSNSSEISQENDLTTPVKESDLAVRRKGIPPPIMDLKSTKTYLV